MGSAALGMGDPPGIDPTSPALAGGHLAPVLPGKSSEYLYTKSLYCVQLEVTLTSTAGNS